MKKNKTTDQLKREYEKVYEAPLNWCPLFGYLPEIEGTHLYEDKQANEIATRCIDIIHNARDNFGFDYRSSLMVKNTCLPELEIIFPVIENDTKNEYKALRFLFQNLDYLALKTASSYSPLIAMQLSACGEIKAFPYRPIGRVSNLYDDCFSTIAENVKVDQIVREYILSEAQKITGEAIKLEHAKLLSLYAILEAWLVLTALLFMHGYSRNDLLNFNKKLIYADSLLVNAQRHAETEYLDKEVYDVIQKNSGDRKYGAAMSKEIRGKKAEDKTQKWVNLVDDIFNIDKEYKGKTSQNNKWLAVKIDTKLGTDDWNRIRRDKKVLAKFKECKATWIANNQISGI